MNTGLKMTRDSVLDELDGHSLSQQIEIMANVFIGLGFQHMLSMEGTIEDMAKELEGVTPESLLRVVTDDVRENGETLGNALARQGIMMLVWLEQQKKRE